MAEEQFTIDYGGARGSNAGDEYHELWAARQTLRLLDENAPLSAMTVEGLRVEDGTGAFWDGVDCTLFYEGDSSSTAARVELQQFKYSAANPASPWTVTRLATGRGGNVASSPIRKLANAYKKITEKRSSKPADWLKVALVTNQPIDTALAVLIEQSRTTVPTSYKKMWKPGDPELHRLVHASGLKPTAFKDFAQVLDLQGKSGSRFAVEEAMLKSVAEWSDAEFREAASRLREYVRDRMLPESAGDLINREKVLLRFGVSDQRALFPCPSALKLADNAVPRAAAKEVVDRMLAGLQHVCFHGVAGVGKTTALQEIGARLPVGSMMVTFDCYGGGSYLDASALRHRPEDAFLQLSNDLARQLHVPLLLEPHGPRDFARAFRKRLDQAAALLERAHPDALLLVAIDAADNSVTAAQQRSPSEKTFVHELVSFSDLPRNVRLVVSARTGRRKELHLPRQFEQVELLAFDEPETAANVGRYWAAPPEWVEDFHYFSSGIPRVQGYAFENARDAPIKAIDALRPLGKKLDQVFHERFDVALTKAGRAGDLQLVCAGLVALARPIPIAELAAVLQFDEAEIADVCADLAPGVRNDRGFLRFADEDFEAFVREAALGAMADVRLRTANRFLERALTDAYAAFNVAPALLAAGRRKELLDFVEQTPEPATALIRDPVRRREVQLQRLLTAISVCREAGNTARALRFVLIGAEAIGTDTATRSLLAAYPELTARYAKETASRLILGDPDRVKDHGALLAQLLAEDAAKGDAIAVREGRRRLQAWSEARHDEFRKLRQLNEHARPWEITYRDGAAALYAMVLNDGPKHAVARLGHFRPWGFALGSARNLIERLLAERRFDAANALAAAVPDAWAVFLLVPLAMAAQPIDYERLRHGLQSFQRRFRLDVKMLGHLTSEDTLGPYVVDIVLSGAEILAAKAISPETVQSLLAAFLDPEIRRVDRRHDFESNHLDAILRCYCLAETLAGREVKAEDVLVSRPTPAPESEQEGSRQSDGREHDQGIRELVTAVTGFYQARARAIASLSGRAGFESDFSDAHRRFAGDSWRFDRRRGSSSIRAKVAEDLMVLVAIGVDPDLVLTRALEVRTGTWPDGESGVARFVTRLAAIPQLHARVLTEITRVAKEARRARTGAEEKSRTLAAYARLLVPISPPDADAVFKWAIEVASELDSEAMDQLRFTAGLIERAVPALGDAAAMARSFAEVIRDGGIRLENVDHFPWDDTFRGLAQLDIPTALSSAARWDDTNIAGLECSLAPIVSVGVDGGNITRVQALAMLGMLERAGASQLETVMGDDGGADAIAEELAHDLIGDRIAPAQEVVAFIERHGTGTWAKYFLAQQEFERASPTDPESKTGSSNKEERRSLLESHVWPDAIVIDGEKLADAAQDMLKNAREAGEFLSMEDVLKHARSGLAVGLRTRHLDALAILVDRLSTREVLSAILAAIDDWQEQLAVVDWCKAHLPELIAAGLPSLALYLPWDRRLLEAALAKAQASDEQVQAIILDGIERNAGDLGAGATFALAREIAVRLSPAQAAVLCKWYIERLVARIEHDDQERIAPEAIPKDPGDAVARFFLAYLSDVDVRQRWRAAHSLRRLARLGGASTISKIVGESGRREESAFRDPSAPFYWIAANLWLVIALGRIASETPAAVAPHGIWLLDTALSDAFPHLLLRDYAADACRALVAGGQMTLSARQRTDLENVNRSRLPRGTKTRSYGGSFEGPGGRQNKEERRFHFDGLDTLRYWYEPWLRAFEGLRPDEFLESAERWIVDAWGVQDEKPYGSKEPRQSRFSERDWTLANASHGSMPTIEHHRTYLEWHAMWCAAGEMLKKHAIAKAEYEGDDPVKEGISWNKLSVPGIWAADLVGPRPLERQRWRVPPAGHEWYDEISDESFLGELMPASRPGFVVVDAYIHGRWARRRETVRVHSGLVSGETAHALLRALQTVEDSFDYYLCPEGDDREIDDSEYTLLGWLKHNNGDPGFDKKDVYSNEITRLTVAPGDRVTVRFGLERQFGTGCVLWTRHGQTMPSFVYEAWGQREHDERRAYYGSNDGSRGQRIMIRADHLTEFLAAERYDLITEVGVSRRDEKQRPYTDDEEEAQDVEFDRVFLLRADGRIEAAERVVGSWREDRA